MSGASEAEVIAFLKARAPQQIDTACAHVFLEAERAWKIKRHVDLGYADFSTAEKRLWALRRELDFNQVAAPDIYRAVRAITREADGALALEGAGEPVEYLLEMRRFDERQVLAANPDALDGVLAEALGRTIAGFHAAAPLRPNGGAAALAFTVGSNAQLLRETCPGLDTQRVELLLELTGAELIRQQPLLEARTAAGFSRRCHGDLHLGNILMEHGRPVLFDCIEFNDLLSDLDIQYDLAFLLMDLDFRDRRDAAVRVLSAYLDEAARVFPGAIWLGLAAMPLMLSVRAGVRAHVEAHSGRTDVARDYVEAGIRHLSPIPPALAAVGGFSGSGKSTFARGLAPALGASPGAVVLRTDEIRKRVLNIRPTDPAPPEAYERPAYTATYDAMMDNALDLLRAGRAVVLDASFMDAELRARAERLANAAGVPFFGFWLDAPAEILAARVSARQGDASDATLDVLHGQIAQGRPNSGWRSVDASRDVAEAARNLGAALF